MLVALVDGRIVGHAGLHAAGKSPRRAHVMQVGIELTVYTDNERALALYRKAGFVIEGTHKAHALRDGRYIDSHSMARIRPKAMPV